MPRGWLSISPADTVPHANAKMTLTLHGYPAPCVRISAPYHHLWMESATEEATPAPAAAPSPLPQLSSPHAATQSEADQNLSSDEIGDDNANANAQANTNENHHNHHNPNDTAGTTHTPLDSAASSTKSRPASSVVPPFWQRHERTVSRASLSSLAQSRIIRLEDHTADPDSETSRGLWARSVAIEDYVVVQGKSGVGSYVVWNCTIQTLDVSLLCCCGKGVCWCCWLLVLTC